MRKTAHSSSPSVPPRRPVLNATSEPPADHVAVQPKSPPPLEPLIDRTDAPSTSKSNGTSIETHRMPLPELPLFVTVRSMFLVTSMVSESGLATIVQERAARTCAGVAMAMPRTRPETAERAARRMELVRLRGAAAA
jgi:hypothetical protein